MLRSYLVWLSAIILLAQENDALSNRGCLSKQRIPIKELSGISSGHNHEEESSQSQKTKFEVSRGEWISNTLSIASASLLAGCFVSNPPMAIAEDDGAPSTASSRPGSYSITKCPTNSKIPCVSTANVRNLDLYLPPWTYTTTSEEAMARLKGAIVSDSSCEIIQQDGYDRLLVQAKRGGADVFGTTDKLEFIVNDADKVITFRSAAPNDSPDFGINKRRLDDIRKRAGIFGIMGESMNSADSFTDDQKGYGPLGQLKAFYGYQSGAGYEDVLSEK